MVVLVNGPIGSLDSHLTQCPRLRLKSPLLRVDRHGNEGRGVASREGVRVGVPSEYGGVAGGVAGRGGQVTIMASASTTAVTTSWAEGGTPS